MCYAMATGGPFNLLKWVLRKVGWGGMDWINMVQDRDQWRALVNMVMNPWVSEKVGKFLSSCTMGLSTRAQLHGVIFILMLTVIGH
jgi:hypothetical protein